MAELGNIIAGKYEILRQIGEGGMSRVYLAMDLKLNKQWAVKEIKASTNPVEQEIIRESLVTETNMIKRLDHPALPRITDLAREGDTLYVVMDYIEGESLSRILKDQGPQSQEDVIDWGRQLCDALDYLHMRTPPVIYRDMKPSNVMLKPDGTIKIIDFGIAREYRDEHAGGNEKKIEDTTMLGTKGYAAPEQFGGMGQTDTRTDVYCLGATLYHLLTNKNPAEAPYVMYPIRQINSTLSPGLEKIISKATQQDPEQRYSSCAEMLFELEHYDTADNAYRKKLKRKWCAFLCICFSAAACLSVGIFGAIMAEVSKSEDYGLQIEAAIKASDKEKAVAHYLDAIAIKPEQADAYLRLVKLFKDDATFSTDEETQLLQALIPNLSAIQSDQAAYANLTFEVGKLYWYYYDYATDAGDNRLTRIKSSGQWMSDAATAPDFDQHMIAEIYTDIAAFNNGIVAHINEGGDEGYYEPYFRSLERLTTLVVDGENDVVTLETSELVSDALHAYARKFRADGISQTDMQMLLDKARVNAELVQPTTERLDGQKSRILANDAVVRKTIDNAFVDARAVR